MFGYLRAWAKVECNTSAAEWWRMTPREVAFLYSAWLDRVMSEDLRTATIVCAVYNSSASMDRGSRAIEPSDVFKTIPKRKMTRMSRRQLAKTISGFAS